MKAHVKVLSLVLIGAIMWAIAIIPTLSADADIAGDQIDSVRFQLGSVEPPESSDPPALGHMVYCGIRAAEPFVLDVAVTNPPNLGTPHTGWLGIGLQDPQLDEFADGSRFEFSVPFNDSFAFSQSLGGHPGVDQIVQIGSPALGDEFGGGAPFRGMASVRAPSGALDPFRGDNRGNNYCVSIGRPGGVPGAEYLQGAISTTLSVPDWWVEDGNGADGGVLVGFEG